MKKETFNVMLIGMIGSGKSQVVHRLKSVTPRLVILDRVGEYASPGESFRDFREAAEFYRANMDRNFHMILRTPDGEAGDVYCLSWLELLYQVQKDNPELPPVTLVMDEASYLSDSYSAPRAVDQVYTKGRHARINIVTCVQRMTQVNATVRDQSHVWIALRMMSLPGVMKERFPADMRDRIPELEPVTPRVDWPEYGRHYFSSAGPDYPWLRKYLERNPGAVKKSNTV